MADIFLSYSSSDRRKAKAFAEAVAQRGWSVWWDRKIPYGKTFDEVIEENLEAAKCVIVLWSKESASSKWVKVEASEGARRGILTPVLLEENPKIPLEFRLMQGANLADWQPGVPHAEFQQLLEHIDGILGSQTIDEVEEQAEPTSPTDTAAWPFPTGFLLKSLHKNAGSQQLDEMGKGSRGTDLDEAMSGKWGTGDSRAESDAEIQDYLDAAEEGDPDAQHDIGSMYW